MQEDVTHMGVLYSIQHMLVNKSAMNDVNVDMVPYPVLCTDRLHVVILVCTKLSLNRSHETGK